MNFEKHIIPYLKTSPVICPSCGKVASLSRGMWRCNPCALQTPCEKNSNTPLGPMANLELSHARKALLRSFNRYYSKNFFRRNISAHEAQKRAIQSICRLVDMPTSLFNIHTFDLELCKIIHTSIEKALEKSKPLCCQYCGKQAVYIPTKRIFRCDPCDAQVGVHKDTNKPLGTLANANLRKARMKAHSAFDPLWLSLETNGYVKSSNNARKGLYKWLSHKMGIPFAECHIALFNEQQCEDVIFHCNHFKFSEYFVLF